jgi:hypothetical protein
MPVTYKVDDNQIKARNILVEGEVHISCDIDIKRYPKITNEELYNTAESITVIGDLYIQTDKFICENAIIYAKLNDFKKSNNIDLYPYDINNMKIDRSETFNDNLSISKKNVCMDAKEVLLYGNIVSEGNITIHSNKVWEKIRNEKINNLKINIKKQQIYE